MVFVATATVFFWAGIIALVLCGIAELVGYECIKSVSEALADGQSGNRLSLLSFGSESRGKGSRPVPDLSITKRQSRGF